MSKYYEECLRDIMDYVDGDTITIDNIHNKNIYDLSNEEIYDIADTISGNWLEGYYDSEEKARKMITSDIDTVYKQLTYYCKEQDSNIHMLIDFMLDGTGLITIDCITRFQVVEDILYNWSKYN